MRAGLLCALLPLCRDDRKTTATTPTPFHSPLLSFHQFPPKQNNSAPTSSLFFPLSLFVSILFHGRPNFFSLLFIFTTGALKFSRASCRLYQKADTRGVPSFTSFLRICSTLLIRPKKSPFDFFFFFFTIPRKKNASRIPRRSARRTERREKRNKKQKYLDLVLPPAGKLWLGIPSVTSFFFSDNILLLFRIHSSAIWRAGYICIFSLCFYTVARWRKTSISSESVSAVGAYRWQTKERLWVRLFRPRFILRRFHRFFSAQIAKFRCVNVGNVHSYQSRTRYSKSAL